MTTLKGFDAFMWSLDGYINRLNYYFVKLSLNMTNKL